jgi:hypothetical protein
MSDRNLPEDAEFERRFQYHQPRPDQVDRYARIRAKARDLAIMIKALCPEGREFDNAQVHVEEAVFWANAAIARNEANRAGG